MLLPQALHSGALGTFVALFVNVGVPALGLYAYVRLLQRIEAEGIAPPPAWPLFFLFVAYGGWLVIGLTVLFWEWSGMASIGTGMLVAVWPLVLLGVAVASYRTRERSRYHRAAFWASALYPGFVAILWVAAQAAFGVFKL